MAPRTSANANCCSRLSISSRVSRVTFASRPLANELPRSCAETFGAAALRRCALAAWPPALGRPFIGSLSLRILDSKRTCGWSEESQQPQPYTNLNSFRRRGDLDRCSGETNKARIEGLQILHQNTERASIILLCSQGETQPRAISRKRRLRQSRQSCDRSTSKTTD